MTALGVLRSPVALAGEFAIFAGESLRSVGGLWRRRHIFLKQCEQIGVGSMGISVTAGFFLGGVLGYQLYAGYHRFGAEAFLGGTVGVALFRELGPTIAAIMVTGRAGAAMAAEIATMRITEQIDALEVMAVNPIEYLVTPRVMAGLVMMPLLAMFFCVVASVASALVGCGIMGLSYPTYWTQFASWVDGIELVHCLVKAAAFGLILTWVGCFCGYRASGGAGAVGLATKTAVVATCLLILLADFVLTSFLPWGWSTLEVM